MSQFVFRLMLGFLCRLTPAQRRELRQALGPSQEERTAQQREVWRAAAERLRRSQTEVLQKINSRLSQEG